MDTIMLIGTAGSGKSSLTYTLSRWLEENDKSTGILNLDPGVRWLPYPPDIDIRDYINLDQIMVHYELGPNGALIAAVDMMINHIKDIREEVKSLDCEYLLIDTPGQMELFAFRRVGPQVISKISEENMIILFLIDAMFTQKPSDFASALLLATSVQYRFLKPQINIISKADLLSQNLKEKIEEWIEDPETLKMEIISSEDTLQSEISQRIVDVISEEMFAEIVFTSSITGEGGDALLGRIERILGKTIIE
ncbi:MAG: ATP/GTP-binding protein [archaeon YNP-WB-062]|jgi:GTPase SAR1 family protein|nr:ATP/GTP-binding protein [Candidatus Culexarchaeum yellowstonense]